MIGESKEYITDVLVKALQDDVNKDTLWRLFGNIIYSNIERNLKGTKICCKCNERFIQSNNKMKMCPECAKREKNEQNKKYYRNNA